MICELSNKMEQFCSFTMCPGGYIPNKKVSLTWFSYIFLSFFICLFVMSWWIVPGRFIWNKLNDIEFYCKKGE